MTITISESTEEMLRKRAAQVGQDINRVADTLLASALAWERQEVEAIQEGIDAANQGRERSAREYLGEHKRRYPGP